MEDTKMKLTILELTTLTYVAKATKGSDHEIEFQLDVVLELFSKDYPINMRMLKGVIGSLTKKGMVEMFGEFAGYFDGKITKLGLETLKSQKHEECEA